MSLDTIPQPYAQLSVADSALPAGDDKVRRIDCRDADYVVLNLDVECDTTASATIKPHWLDGGATVDGVTPGAWFEDTANTVTVNAAGRVVKRIPVLGRYLYLDVSALTVTNLDTSLGSLNIRTALQRAYTI